MRKFILSLAVLVSLTIATQAGELFRLKPKTVVVGEARDLDDLMTLAVMSAT
jgi:hypothetical protein